MPASRRNRRLLQPRALALAAAGLAATAGAGAQAPQQIVTPPKAQAWIDVATFSGLGMPAGMAGMMGSGAGGGSPLSMLGGLLGGGNNQNSFGRTRTMPIGRWVDITLRAPSPIDTATLAAPAGFLSPPLTLLAPRETTGTVPPPDESDDKIVEREVERPRGKLLMYWGCGATVRPGQPRVLDFATMSAADLGRFFVTRSATGRGTHAAAGRPLWPNPNDARMVPEQASLAGEHRFSGAGVPENFRFTIPPMQDVMPPLVLQQQRAPSGATELSWGGTPQARAFFVAAMGTGAGGSRADPEMVLWTSSEQPDTGFGLVDYQPNAAIDRWLREKVLLAPSTTSCTVPAGVFGGDGAMLRLVGYGNELNLAFPPRPTDPRQRWDPDWAVKVRVKTVTMGMLGMPDAAAGRSDAAAGDRTADAPAEKKPGALDIIRGILGR